MLIKDLRYESQDRLANFKVTVGYHCSIIERRHLLVIHNAIFLILAVPMVLLNKCCPLIDTKIRSRATKYGPFPATLAVDYQ